MKAAWCFSATPNAIKCTLVRGKEKTDSVVVEAWAHGAEPQRWQRQVSRGRAVEPVELLLTATPPLQVHLGGG